MSGMGEFNLGGRFNHALYNKIIFAKRNDEYVAYIFTLFLKRINIIQVNRTVLISALFLGTSKTKFARVFKSVVSSTIYKYKINMKDL